ncbi:MAG: DUF952 domain-containing protein [Balneolaceae bacterium]|jgi:uncharacterized protein (DUF952 family)
MRDDILFHITTKDDWKKHQKQGKYEPESLETDGFIHCSRGGQLEETANRLFSGLDHLLLLVIDVSTLGEDIKYEKDEKTGEKFPHIYGPLPTNAIIDKIAIRPEKDGTFKISFSSEN